MTIQKHVVKRTPEAILIPALLKQLGVPYNTHSGFWATNSGQLHTIYYDAHKAYRKAIREAHPDAGGSIEKATEVNRMWRLIKKRLKAHLPL